MKKKKAFHMDHFKKSDSVFKVPEGYFESLEDRMGHIIDFDGFNKEPSIEKNKEHGSTLMKMIGKEPGFKVPEGYFERAGSQVPFQKEQKVIPFKKQFISILSIAAAASILLFFGLNNINSELDQINRLEFQDEEFASWIESDLVDLNSYEIAEAFSDIELDHSLYNQEGIDEYLNTLDIENLILDNN